MTNAAAGLALKEVGIESTKAARIALVRIARSIAKSIAAGRDTRLITIDDVYRVMALKGYDTTKLGNAAGSIFKESCWEFVGWRASERVSNHARPVRIWKFL